MAVTYVVRANVIDIRSDVSRPTDRFLVDTNVLAWVHYTGAQYTASGGNVVQAPLYAAYVANARACGASWLRTVASLAELAHLVEQLEHAFYSSSVGTLDVKEYRHNNQGERVRVLGEIKKAWGLIESDSDLLPMVSDQRFGVGLLTELHAALDGYDAMHLQAMRSSGGDANPQRRWRLLLCGRHRVIHRQPEGSCGCSCLWSLAGALSHRCPGGGRLQGCRQREDVANAVQNVIDKRDGSSRW